MSWLGRTWLSQLVEAYSFLDWWSLSPYMRIKSWLAVALLQKICSIRWWRNRLCFHFDDLSWVRCSWLSLSLGLWTLRNNTVLVWECSSLHCVDTLLSAVCITLLLPHAFIIVEWRLRVRLRSATVCSFTLIVVLSANFLSQNYAALSLSSWCWCLAAKERTLEIWITLWIRLLEEFGRGFILNRLLFLNFYDLWIKWCWHLF